MSQPEERQPIQLLEHDPDEEFRPIARQRRRKTSRPKRQKWLRRLVRLRVRWVNILIALVAVAGVVALGAFVLYRDSLERIAETADTVERIVTTISTQPAASLTDDDLNRLVVSLDELGFSLFNAQRRLAPVEPFRRFNPALDIRLTQMEAAENLVLAARSMIGGLEPALRFVVSGEELAEVVAPVASSERVVELLRAGRGSFINAGSQLAAAAGALDRLETAAMPPAMQLDVLRLRGYHTSLVQLNTQLSEAPELLALALGLDEAQTYLLLVHNSDQLRPSGGLIQFYGVMTVRNGRISAFDFAPTTPDHPAPPPPSADLPAAPDWWTTAVEGAPSLRTTNWSPDFPTAAREALAYYNNSPTTDTPADGVIALSLDVFETLLTLRGELRVAEFNSVVTPADFDALLYDPALRPDTALPPDEYMAGLLGQLFIEWQALSQEPGGSEVQFGLLVEALRTRQIMLYSRDEALNTALAALGWAGGQQPARDHDYILLADANLVNFANNALVRQLTYSAAIQPDGSVTGEVVASYDYPTDTTGSNPALNADRYPLDYRGLLQVFIPARSTLVSTDDVPAEPLVIAESDHTRLIVETAVPYGELERYAFTYTTEPLVEPVGSLRRYRLLLQKQPGTGATVASVLLELPVGAQIVAISPEPVTAYSIDRPTLEFRVALTTDQWVEVVYQEP